MFKLRQIKDFCRITTTLQASFVPRTSTIYQKTDIANKSSSSQQLQSNRQIHMGELLQKYNKNSRQQDDDEDSDEDSSTEFKDERDSKVLKASVNSLRADLLLKAGLGMARK